MRFTKRFSDRLPRAVPMDYPVSTSFAPQIVFGIAGPFVRASIPRYTQFDADPEDLAPL